MSFPQPAICTPQGRGFPVGDTVTARELAAVLHESQVQMIARALKVLGPERCITLLTEALLCEHEGGMLTKEGTRRSMGGIFLQLCLEQATREEWRKIFG